MLSAYHTLILAFFYSKEYKAVWEHCGVAIFSQEVHAKDKKKKALGIHTNKLNTFYFTKLLTSIPKMRRNLSGMIAK